jgi:hypothetical protein
MVTTGGFVFLLPLIGKYLFGTPLVAGWKVLVAIICLFAGLLLFALGIVGEYLLRILDGISHKPPYLVRTVVGASAPAHHADGDAGTQGTSFFPANREHDRTLDAADTKPI